MEADQTTVPAPRDDLWDEVVPYPMWFCVIVQVSGFLVLGAMIFGIGWLALRAANWIMG